MSQSKITEQVVLAYPRTDKCIASDITGLTRPGILDKVYFTCHPNRLTFLVDFFDRNKKPVCE